jgi:TatA/E family protein of Tat protein translocase
MGSLGVPELIIIFVVALIVFGPKKLPELGKSLGKGLAEFRRASNELKSTIEEEVRAIEAEPPPARHYSEPELEPESKSESEPAPKLDSKTDSETNLDAH